MLERKIFIKVSVCLTFQAKSTMMFKTAQILVLIGEIPPIAILQV